MTIKDIARISGVSVSTVSRVLNDHPDVSAEAREKVLAVVAEYNYIPNNSARELGKSTSDNIGLIVRGYLNPFFTKIIQEIEHQIDESGYTMVMQQISSNDDEVMAAAMMEREKRLLGLIFLGGRLDYTPEQMAAIHVPFVCCSFNNTYGTLDRDSYSSVSIDDSVAGYVAVKKLFDEGHRRIAVLLSGQDDGSVSQIRYEGYKRALKEFGLDDDENLIIKVGSFNINESYVATTKWLENKPEFDSIFAIADNLAIGAMKALRENGISVPKECSIVSIDGIEMSEFVHPVLSTYAQPMEELGRKSVEIIVNLVKGTGVNQQLILPTEFREGKSIVRV